MIKIGLTGGIAAGKSSICNLWQKLYNVAIFDADKTVHKIYNRADVIDVVSLIVPQAVQNYKINRVILGEIIKTQPDILDEIEEIIHPLVRLEERKASKIANSFGYDMIISDIPLLLENNLQNRYDYIVVVNSPLWLRRKRAMQRSNMSERKLQEIISRQVSDAQRIKAADFVINTSIGRAESVQNLKQIMYEIMGR
jgi:dephospho-CoA kinase